MCLRTSTVQSDVDVTYSVFRLLGLVGLRPPGLRSREDGGRGLGNAQNGAVRSLDSSDDVMALILMFVRGMERNVRSRQCCAKQCEKRHYIGTMFVWTLDCEPIVTGTQEARSRVPRPSSPWPVVFGTV